MGFKKQSDKRNDVQVPEVKGKKGRMASREEIERLKETVFSPVPTPKRSEQTCSRRSVRRR